MSVTVLIGSQWGDEGKGKIIDVLTRKADWVVRFQGGNNAGHTVEIGDDKYVLHLAPSGILRADKRCVIGNGLVVDLVGLCEELQDLEKRGIEISGRLFISDRAHLVLPYHKALDGAREQSRSDDKIGTTKRGIGPAYADKANRSGLRAADILEDDFMEQVARRIEENNQTLQILGGESLDIVEMLNEISEAVDYLKPFIGDTIPMLNEALESDEAVLLEGAQGIMLDIDYGSYPYVTSSNTGSSGVASGAGIPPQSIDRVLGVIKAYTTRVGEGPFPTEEEGEIGKTLATVGSEFGATTGRPRRCGWFDAVIARYSAMVNGINRWSLMKLDVLDGLEKIKICVAYECDGERIETIPASNGKLSRCKPIYEEVEGWNCSTRDATSFAELPQKAQDYIERIEEITGVEVAIASVGPKRSSTIVKEDLI